MICVLDERLVVWSSKPLISGPKDIYDFQLSQSETVRRVGARMIWSKQIVIEAWNWAIIFRQLRFGGLTMTRLHTKSFTRDDDDDNNKDWYGEEYDITHHLYFDLHCCFFKNISLKASQKILLPIWLRAKIWTQWVMSFLKHLWSSL